MRDLLPKKEQYLMNFANSMYAEFRQMKYGIQTCRRKTKAWLDELRKDIIEYELNPDTTITGNCGECGCRSQCSCGCGCSTI